MAEGRGFGPRSRKNEPFIKQFSSSNARRTLRNGGSPQLESPLFFRGAIRAFLLSLHSHGSPSGTGSYVCIFINIYSLHTSATALWRISTAFHLTCSGELAKNGFAILKELSRPHSLAAKDSRKGQPSKGLPFHFKPACIVTMLLAVNATGKLWKTVAFLVQGIVPVIKVVNGVAAGIGCAYEGE
jgi:hypothetical protein